MSIRMFDVQYWKRNNICNTWKIKKGKTKNLNVVYLLKRINGLCNFNFYFKIKWPPRPSPPPNKITPHQDKNFSPPAKTFLKFLIPPPLKLEGGGGVHAMLHLCSDSCITSAYILNNIIIKRKCRGIIIKRKHRSETLKAWPFGIPWKW